MHQLVHPHLVQLLGVCTADGGKLLIVTELMSPGCLLTYLRKQVQYHPSRITTPPHPSSFIFLNILPPPPPPTLQHHEM